MAPTGCPGAAIKSHFRRDHALGYGSKLGAGVDEEDIRRKQRILTSGQYSVAALWAEGTLVCRETELIAARSCTKALPIRGSIGGGVEQRMP